MVGVRHQQLEAIGQHRGQALLQRVFAPEVDAKGRPPPLQVLLGRIEEVFPVAEHLAGHRRGYGGAGVSQHPADAVAPQGRQDVGAPVDRRPLRALDR